MKGCKLDAMVIRDYCRDDWPRLQEIHDAARKNELRLAGLDEAFLPLTVAAEAEGLFDYTVRVAWLEDTAAGFSAFTEDELAWLYVDPALSRRGVGTRLVRDALEHMGRPVTLEVLAGNEPARRLYERCGFRLVKTVSGRMPGNESFSVTCHVLQLD